MIVRSIKRWIFVTYTGEELGGGNEDAIKYESVEFTTWHFEHVVYCSFDRPNPSFP